MADLREQIEALAREYELSDGSGGVYSIGWRDARLLAADDLRAALTPDPAPSLAEARREAAPEVLAAIDEVLGAPLGPSTIVIDLARERLREVRRALASPPQKDTRSTKEG